MKYIPSDIEPKWQRKWEEEGIYKPDLGNAKKPFYNLMMFPYPSAEGMHVGNMYAFTGSDVYGRFQKMLGKNVFEPIGLDGFGIHSENYALKIGQHPMDQAKRAEKNFYRQLKATGNGFDWSRTVETYDPKYYKWTQWIFIELFKKGLAYRKKAPVNFCPSCKTVLADEQVVKKSKISSRLSHLPGETDKHLEGVNVIAVCERCSTPVEKKELEQWFFRITKYADRLLANLTKLNWSEKVKIAQKEWIGKKTGINIKYKISNLKSQISNLGSSSDGGRLRKVTPCKARCLLSQDRMDSSEVEPYIECFTTRPDTNFGATFVVIAPEHPFVATLLKLKAQSSKLKNEIQDYVERAKKKSQQERMAGGREKTGVFTGLYCINNLNNYKMPLYISDFVLMEFGTGAVVGVPGHDARDYEFAKEFKLPIIRVVVGRDKDASPITKKEQVWEEEGTMINSEFLNGMDIHTAAEKIMDYLEEKGWGKRTASYHLRDWLISRQRYWGAPIPMIFCSQCALASKGLALQGLALRGWDAAGWFPVPEDQLPVKLPYIQDYKPLGSGKSPLAAHPEFYKTVCPGCGGEACRETDVSDTFLDSAWYYFRYLCTECDDIPFPSKAFTQRTDDRKRKTDSRKTDKTENSDSGTPSNQSFRNPSSVFRFLSSEIANRVRWLPVAMYIGGAEHSVLHLLYSRFITMVFKDLGLIDFEEPFARFYAHGLLIKEGAKMSKSKGNAVIPDEYVKKYGADTVRTYLMFLGPFNQGGDFYDTGIEGMHRFLKRVWRLVSQRTEDGEQKTDSRKTDKTENSDSGTPSNQSFRNPSSVFCLPSSEIMMHKTIKGVTKDLEGLRYNTAIAKLMEYYNFLSDQKEISRKEIIVFLKLLAPFAPHMTEELFHNVILSDSEGSLANASFSETSSEIPRSARNDKRSIHTQPWPTYDPKLLKEEEATIVVQVNGKVRDTLKVQSSKFKVQSYVEEKVKESAKIKKYLEGKKIKKIVYVEGRILNFVIE